VKAPIADLADFAALDPFFRIIEQGLNGLAELSRKNTEHKVAATYLAGQVAIVAGAGRGLGRSHAELLAVRGPAGASVRSGTTYTRQRCRAL
jgi:hypothetical protein